MGIRDINSNFQGVQNNAFIPSPPPKNTVSGSISSGKVSFISKETFTIKRDQGLGALVDHFKEVFGTKYVRIRVLTEVGPQHVEVKVDSLVKKLGLSRSEILELKGMEGNLLETLVSEASTKDVEVDKTISKILSHGQPVIDELKITGLGKASTLKKVIRFALRTMGGSINVDSVRLHAQVGADGKLHALASLVPRQKLGEGSFGRADLVGRNLITGEELVTKTARTEFEEIPIEVRPERAKKAQEDIGNEINNVNSIHDRIGMNRNIYQPERLFPTIHNLVNQVCPHNSRSVPGIQPRSYACTTLDGRKGFCTKRAEYGDLWKCIHNPPKGVKMDFEGTFMNCAKGLLVCTQLGKINGDIKIENMFVYKNSKGMAEAAICDWGGGGNIDTLSVGSYTKYNHNGQEIYLSSSKTDLDYIRQEMQFVNNPAHDKSTLFYVQAQRMVYGFGNAMKEMLSAAQRSPNLSQAERNKIPHYRQLIQKMTVEDPGKRINIVDVVRTLQALQSMPTS